jgi:hypothetical protein
MHTLKVKLTDGVYATITKAAAKRGVSVNEIVDDWLLAGEETSNDESEQDREEFEANIEHHMRERRALREYHESIRVNRLLPQRKSPL